MTKKYMKDNGKVRLCASNIAKMNLLESMYYHRYRMWENIVKFISNLKENLYLVKEIIIIIILPFVYPLMAWWEIRRARKVMKEMES